MSRPFARLSRGYSKPYRAIINERDLLDSRTKAEGATERKEFRRALSPFDSADYLNGLYYALLEGRFVFDFVHQEDLSAETLAKYRALLIPNAAYFRDSECATVHEYAARGGSVLATFETSRYNEWGERREDFGLAGVFGANALGETLGPQDNTYMRIEQRHAVTGGFEGTELLPGAESRVAVKAVQTAPLVLSVVPHYPWYPPEMVYPRATKTTEPAVILRQDGRSRIAYFPGDIDRTFWSRETPTSALSFKTPSVGSSVTHGSRRESGEKASSKYSPGRLSPVTRCTS